MVRVSYRSKPKDTQNTHSSNSWSIEQSFPRAESGVVTKWIPLFSVHVIVVGSTGTGTSRFLSPTTSLTRD